MRREQARASEIGKNVMEGDDETAEKDGDLLRVVLETCTTFHLLTSLLKLTAWRNAVRREKARVLG